MELYLLRTFVAVAQAGHVTRASEKLHISQPAVSGQIKALEGELDLALFERTSGGMELTFAGERLLEDAEKVLAAAQGLRNCADALKGKVGGNVSVGTLSDPLFIRLGEFMSATLERHPLLRLELHHEISGNAFTRVRHGELDASFYFGSLTHPGVDGLRLRGIAYRVAAPAAWRDRVADAGSDEIAALPWIVTPPISTHYQLVRALFDKHYIEPIKVVEADEEYVIASLVVSGVGLSLIREELALEKEAAGEVCLWRDVRLETDLWFIYRAARSRDPVIRAIVDVLTDVWGLGALPRAAATPGPSGPK